MDVAGKKCNEISLKHLKFGMGEEGEFFSKALDQAMKTHAITGNGKTAPSIGNCI